MSIAIIALQPEGYIGLCEVKGSGLYQMPPRRKGGHQIAKNNFGLITRKEIGLTTFCFKATIVELMD